jgi:hypothetical protein
MPNVTNITPPRVPLTDPNTGIITREWYRFFLNLFTLTGGGTNDVSLSDLQKGPPMSTEVYEEINNIYNRALLASPPVQLGTLSSVNQDNVTYLGFQTGFALGYTPPVGTVFWGGGTTLNIQNTANVAQPVGEVQYFYIKATATITKGQLIMFDGAVGASGQLKGKPATGLTDGQYLMGVAAENIAVNGFGIVTSFGLVRGFNTTGGAEAWTDGTILYYNPAVPGGMTKNIPSAPNVKAVVAAVVNAAGGGSGSVFVRTTFGSALGQTDSNVQFSTLANNDFIQYYSAGGYWRNVTATSVIVGVATNLAGGVTGSVPYQTSANNTTFLGIGTAAQVLQVNAGATAPEWVSSTGTGNVVRATAPALTGQVSITGSGSTSSTYSVIVKNSSGVDVFLIRDDGYIRAPTVYSVTVSNAPNMYVDTNGYIYRSTATVGTVTSVDVSGGSTGLTTSGGPITGSGTITIAGALGAGYGGTGQSSYAVGDILYASASTTLSKLAAVATGNALISGGVTTAPSWGKIGLTTHVSGVLPVANGGTNASSASITAFNNITGYTASGATGTTSTKLVFSAVPSFDTTIGVGAATASASGAGVSFPAAQSASSDANTLDDYEEGTWTVALTDTAGKTYVSGTNFTATGTYTKIGRLVSAQAVITLTATLPAGAAGQLLFSLPFTPATTQSIGTALETALTGYLCRSAVFVGDNYAYVTTYDNNSMIAANAALVSLVTYIV